MGFWTVTPCGHIIHINGDLNMSKDALEAICSMFDKAIGEALKDENKTEISDEVNAKIQKIFEKS